MATLVRRLMTVTLGTALLATAAGCNNNSATTPSPVLSSEDSSGTIPVGGESIQLFTINYQYGATDAEITVKTLTSVATGSALNVKIGVAFGTYTSFNNTCTRAAAATRSDATIGTPYPTNGGLFPSAGQYCAVVYDPGTLTEPANYTMTVRHY